MKTDAEEPRGMMKWMEYLSSEMRAWFMKLAGRKLSEQMWINVSRAEG